MSKIYKTVTIPVEVDITHEDVADAERKRIVDRIKHLSNRIFRNQDKEYPSNVMDLLVAWINGWEDQCHKGYMDGIKKEMADIDAEGFNGYDQKITKAGQ
jgi:hypothetical protein